MEELCKKYPKLRSIKFVVEAFKDNNKKNKDATYSAFKKDINSIGLDPEEYETVIKWFCDTMEY